MIIVRIVGGLASQMHKYAVGRALSLHHQTELKLDLDWFYNRPPSDTPWPYHLSKFAIAANVASQKEIRKSCGHPFWNGVKIYTNRLSRNFQENNLKFDFGKLTQDRWENLPDNAYLYGETGGDTFIRPIRATLQQDFQLIQPLTDSAKKYLEQIQASNYAVSLHVRRGDFISNKSAALFHALTGLDYFHQAVAVVQRAHMNAQFFVFSDDPDWVAEHLLPTLPSGSVCVTSLASEEDFVLMSRCHGNIISNSGFSWTAAWLNDTPDRLVISPSRWLKDEVSNAHTMKALHQPNWVYL